MATQIQLRRGTSAEWAASTRILAQGEVGIDLTLGEMRLGDGVTAWAGLPVVGSVDAASETVAGVVEFATTAEATAGTDTTRAVTPAGVAAAIDAAGSGAYPVQQVTLTGNLAYTLPVGAPTDQVVGVVFTQDAAGGHTVTYGGAPVTVDTTAGASTLVEVWPGGTLVYPGAATGGTVSPEDLAVAVAAYLVANPVASGSVDAVVWDEASLTYPARPASASLAIWRGPADPRLIVGSGFVTNVDLWAVNAMDAEAPTAVTNLTATPAETSVVLSWTAATDDVAVTGYEYRIGAGSWVDSGTGTTETVTALTADTTYTFGVRAYDAAGNKGPEVTVATTTTGTGDTTPPTWTATFTMGTPTETSVVATVSAMAADDTAVTGYEVSYNDGSTYAAITPAGSDFTLAGTAGTTYATTKLRAKDAAGNYSTALSVPSYTMAASTDTTPPTAGTLAASSITDTTFTLTVTGAADETALAAEPYSFDDGSGVFGDYQASASLAVAGKTAETGYTCQHRVKDAAGNVSTGTAITVTTDASTPVTTLIADTFTRGDGALGTAETGALWTTEGSPWGIVSNEAKMTSGALGAAYQDAGVGDFTATVDIYWRNWGALLFRHASSTSKLAARISSAGFGVLKWEGAAASTTLQNYAFSPVVGTKYTVTVVCSGSTIEGYLDGVLRWTVTNSYNATATHVGLYGGDNVTTYDNLLVTT